LPPRRLLTILASLLVAGCADTLQTDRALIESGKTQEGLARLAADTQKSPQDVSLRQYYYSAREAAVTRWLAQAKSALASGDSKQAAAMLDEVERADPHNPQAAALRHELAQGQGSDADLKAAQAAFAAKHYDEAEATLKARLQRVPQDAASRELMDKIRAERTQAAAQTALDPEYGKGKVSLEFQNAPLRSVFDVLSRQSGLSFAFAPGVPLDRPLTIFAKEIPIAEAITMLVEGNQLTRRALNSHTLLIGTEVPPPPPEPVGSGEVVHAFYLTNADAKQVASLLQSLIPFKNLDVDDSLNLLLVRGNAAQVASAARLISLVDLAQPEVMLEVEVLEVGSDLVRNLGIQYPNQFTLLNVPPSASSVTTPTGTTVTTPSPTPLTVESLLHISADKIAINNPALNLRDDLGKVKLLANPQIRVKNRNDAHVQIGEKVPVFTSSLTPTGVVSNSVSYLDVGLKLDVKPQVLLDDNVQIKLTLEVSSILNQVNNNGTLAYPFAGPLMFYYGDGSLSYQSLNPDYRPWVRSDGPYIKYYNYDPSGNIASLNDFSNNSVLTYAYDATGRLVSAVDTASNGFGSLGYTYDANGNRQSETRNGSSLPDVYSPPGSNWLYQRGSDYRIKNQNGNTAFGTPTGFNAYDGYNRLIQSSNGGAQYVYNALGQRIEKTNASGAKIGFQYGANGELLYEQDAAGNTKAYVWLNGRPIARIDNNQQIYYYHVDHLGTPQAMTDSMGTVVWKAYYEPFGTATVRPVSTIENNLRLPGQYYDSETGMHYNYFRDYDPTTGRYIEADPMGLAAGPNVYAYVGGNPLSFIDPLGLFDNDAYTAWMIKHAKKHSQHQCAKYVRKGLEAGGADTTGHPIDAKAYADTLTKNGFTEVPTENYTPAPGDTAIFQPYPAGNPSGHIETYTNQGWKSDFSQKSFLPNKKYGQSPYKVYRPPEDDGDSDSDADSGECGCQK